ncbi:MAG: hypothetical protein KAS72_10890 [Phycisphaerales bacterium]|nr:hypothetical protein [Phycisphaerales bacterium]
MHALTVFAIPKAFHSHTGVIQRNAIRSWRRMGWEVSLLGDEAGTAEMAAEVEAAHLPNVARNDMGTPLLDSAFNLARDHATTDLIAYVNSDIIFLNDLASVIGQLRFPEFLAVGRRTNITLDTELDFERSDWRRSVRHAVDQSGKLFTEFGIDYFVMPRRSELTDLPPFAVGRARWDNWMCARSWRLGVPLVDLTECVLAVHQDHDHTHVKGRGEHQYSGPEAAANAELAGGDFMSIADATYIVDERGRPVPSALNLARMHYQTAVRETTRMRSYWSYARAAVYLTRTGKPLQAARDLLARRSA